MTDTFEIRWSEAAVQDLETILAFIRCRAGAATARRLLSDLLAAIESLTTHPLRCRIVPELNEIGVTTFRELIHGHHRICFTVHDRQVVLVSILDGRRDLEELLVSRALGRS